MPVTDYQGSSSSPSPFSFGRSLLSLRRDHAAMPSGEEADLEAFQRHVATTLAELLPSGDGDGGGGGGGGGAGGEEILSVGWIRRLLEAFILCQEEFRVVVAQARRRGGALPANGERMVVEFHEKAVKALDVCNAARDGVDQVRRWERLADIAASVLLAPGEIHEGQLRRARKALSDLAVLLAHHLPAAPPRAAFPWAPPLLTLQERLAEEGKRKDRRNSCGLLKEIHVLEKSTHKLAEAIDAAPIPLFGDREADVREAAAELAAVCAAMRDGLEPLERQVREVFHRIVRSRVEGLDSSMHNAD
uniref:R3H domain-containing protein n=1 Tax=Leersia perrieri TaxID=77586 RepID=A0A0D9XX65_9ORYZ